MHPALWLFFVVGYSFLISAYYLTRYSGRWTDVDTTAITLATNSMKDEGTIFPVGFAYDTGYVYQAVVVFLSHLSGLSVIVLQTMVLPLVGSVLGSIVFFVLFREFLASEAYAALATIVLLTHPDFIFVTLRGSHEKLTWMLAALSIYLLLNSYRQAHNQRRMLINVVLFYFCVYTFISINYFFASSFVLALLTSFILGNLWLQFNKKSGLPQLFRPVFRRYFYIVGSSLVLLMIVMFYAYPPAGFVLKTMKTIGEKIAALFLSHQGTSSALYDTYSVINYGWVSREVYFLLTLINYVVALISFATLVTLIRKPQLVTRERLVLALFYIAFSIQIGAGVVADLAGSLGSNLQLRLMPTWLLASIPLAVTGLKLFLASDYARRYKRLAITLIPVLLVIFSFNSLLKSSNEPIVSNYWQFYSSSEATGLKWTNDHVYHASVWLDYDGIRLQTLWSDLFTNDNRGNESDGARARFETRSFFISEITRRWSGRQNQPLPVPPDALQVYDNGESQLYHLRPLTPFQD